MKRVLLWLLGVLLLAGCSGGPGFAAKTVSLDGLTVYYPDEGWVALDAQTIQSMGGTADEHTMMLLRTDGQATITFVVHDRSREMTAQAYLALTDALLKELGSYLTEMEVTDAAHLIEVQGEQAVDMTYTYWEEENRVTLRQLVLFGETKTVTMTVSTPGDMAALAPLIEEMLACYRLQ